MTTPQASAALGLALALAVFAATPAAAQLHRATHLGNPATRFAKPLTTPQDLRRLLTSDTLKADVAAILDQAGWKGNLEDLRQAAATAEISEWPIAPGTVMPFMSARDAGRPVTLREVLWTGDAPAPAYSFLFVSQGRRYRCITPKACSNFFVVDLGPELALSVVQIAPANASACAPIPLKLQVRNTGGAPLNQVRLTQSLPVGLSAPDARTQLSFDAGTLAPGTGREFTYQLLATAAGTYSLQTHATALEGARADAEVPARVRAPSLTLDCKGPDEVLIGRPAECCLTIKNLGDDLDPRITLTLPIPVGAAVVSTTDGGRAVDGRVIWEIPALAPQTGKSVCATFTRPQPGTMDFAATAHGACAPTVTSQSLTQVAGVAGVRLEVVDAADPVEVGQEVTYDLQVTNQGSARLTNLRLVCTLPDGQEYIAGSGATPVSHADGAVRMEPLSGLDGQAVAKWQVVVKAMQPGDSRFKVELTADQYPQAIERTESTTQY
jgi:uncharacterized repeat protein (TIGR01451 family)